MHLNLPGEGGAGSLVASALEGLDHRHRHRVQQDDHRPAGYSASRVVSTAGDMFDTLIQAVRWPWRPSRNSPPPRLRPRRQRRPGRRR
ncbi:hypothetical protein ACRAWD_22610 [Caulobacter segnis]